MNPLARLPLLFFGMIALVAGVLAGLTRLAVTQVPLPEMASNWAWGHGVLMIPAFFGTVISLERAVALARPWAYLAPLSAGLSGLALITGLPIVVAQGLGILGGAILFAGSALIFRQQTALYTATLALGALGWLVGSVAWLLSGLVSLSVPWWMAFLILTIAGERLELTRYMPTSMRAQQFFGLLMGVALSGLILAFWKESAGLKIYAFMLILLAGWLLRYDIARRTIKQTGLTRFIAFCLMGGYIWLAAGGVLGMMGGYSSDAAGTDLRDAALHSIFLGFVFSMILGHAPIIFPAIVRIRIPYHPIFYLPLIMLHLTLLTRFVTDFLPSSNAVNTWHQLAGLGNAFALAIFILTMMLSVRKNPAKR